MSETSSDVARRDAGTSSRGGAHGGHEPNRARGANRDPQNRRHTAADLLPHIDMPKGGGAIRGIGEKFSVNAPTGTGGLTVPLPLSPGRSGFTPEINLAYNSGSGNGPFGFGWAASLQAITRKTDRGLPRYLDADESDVFILSSAEDLVPVTGAHGVVQRSNRRLHRVPYQITSYVPRVEGGFAKIERWTDTTSGISHWRTINRSNVTSLFGFDPESRVAMPDDPARTFAYRICRSWDDKGNIVSYVYKPDDAAGVDPSQASEAHRAMGGRPAQGYLKSVRYGNITPWYPDWSADSDQTVLPTDWTFELVFDYGDHQDAVPAPVPDRDWPARADAFSTYRSGFEVRTTRFCRRILMFHNFEEIGEKPCLVKALDLAYNEGPAATFLVSVTSKGYLRNAVDGSYSVLAADGRVLSPLSLPPVEFSYTQAQIDDAVKVVDPDDLMGAPAGVDGRRYQWVDLDGEGLPGILSEQAHAWFYNRNVSGFPPSIDTSDARPSKASGGTPVALDGRESVRPRFEGAQVVGLIPSTASLSQGQQIMDLAGEGHQCLVEFNRPNAGYYDREHDGGWGRFTPFAFSPNIIWTDPNLKHIDIDGDGHPDLLISEDEVFTWYPSLAKDGFGPPSTVRKPTDEDRGAAIVFADLTESIYLADMSGDGLTDIVRIRHGEVCYWPNLGYGLFGAKITMDRAPRFDTPDQFDQKRIRLADIDGSGTTDILYLGRGEVTFWYNQSGNGWSEPQRLSQFPDVDNLATVAVVDLLGSGTSCIVWSSQLPGDTSAAMRYIDLMASGKPHLLTSLKNNLGAETRVRYAPSTRFYLQDRVEGRPWITRLAFPVQVVERTETYDYVSQAKYVSRYAYHHGYFDGVEREFRGFGMVEQWDTDSLSRYSGAGLFTQTPPLAPLSLERRGVGGEGSPTAPSPFQGEGWGEVSTAGEEFHLPPAHTKSWYHNGAFIEGDRISRHYSHEYYGADPLAWSLPDSQIPESGDSRAVTPSTLNGQEMREACRALRGHVLRQEVYADDGSPQSLHPYSVSEHTYQVRMLQSLYENRHASFYSFETETLNYHYERNPVDPRTLHNMTLEVDDFGNVTKSAAIGYPRRNAGSGRPPHAPEQLQTLITYTENSFTNRADETDWRRLGLPVEAKAYELTGVGRVADTRPFARSAILDAATSSTEIPYEAVPANRAGRAVPVSRAVTVSRAETSSAPTISSVGGGGLTGALPASEYTAKRLIHQSRTIYLKDDLSGPLPVGQVEPLGLPYESYHMALTPGLVKSVFADKMSDADLVNLLSSEGCYVDLDSNGSWWAPDGHVFFSPDPATPDPSFARAHFYHAQGARDPFGNVSHIAYDPYDLAPVRTEDALGNVTLAQIDYRVLVPALITDQNSNRAAAAIDALGMVSATAIMGKDGANEGDTLADPTTRLEYDLFQWRQHGRPNFVHALAREQHGPANPRWQETYTYSDGLGREIMKKSQAPAGPAPIRDASGVLQRDAAGSLIIQDVPNRWIGGGRSVHDNKGKPVKQYEPYFSSTSDFEDEADLVEQGVTPILRYDPLSRLIRTDMPDGTLSRVEFDPWTQVTYDANDTVLESRWYADRVQAPPPPASGGVVRNEPGWVAEVRAAKLAAVHANTPGVAHLDTLGRPFLTIADNGAAGKYATRVDIDIEGRPKSVTDPRGNTVVRQIFDMIGTVLHHVSMDSGETWQLANAAGDPMRSWDSRGNRVRHTFDGLRRAAQIYVQTGTDPERLVERFVYGESLPDGASNNLRGQPYQHYDAAGIATTIRHDFNGNILQSSRQLLTDYKTDVDWSSNPVPTLDPVTYSASNTFDALSRHITLTTPDQSVATPGYDEANHLLAMAVALKGASAPTSYVATITYNAKGLRERIVYGSGVMTVYDYDPLSHRLRAVKTVRPADGSVLQQLGYTYDPAGNIVEIRDDAQQMIYFNNQVVPPSCQYEYDPIYRLTSATGREHVTQGLGGSPGYADDARKRLPQPSDGSAMVRYTERYEYDPSGNILRMLHNANSSGWSLRYDYDSASNQLNATSLPADPDGVLSAHYQYDAAGNMTSMPHLPLMRWDYKNELAATSQQAVNVGTGEITYYVYAASGERVRKVTESQAAPGQPPVRKEERIYLGGFEIYRSYAAGGGSVGLERETLHVMDDQQRIALVETRTQGSDSSPAQLMRYQFSNHVSSAVLELDELGQIISYEEFYPYGSTSYQAVRSQTETPKRYRYTGKERDEESGLYYHGARYYAPWLGRWTSCDPIGTDHGFNVFEYCLNNPLKFRDADGKAPTSDQARFRQIFEEKKSADPKTAHANTLIQAFRDDSISGKTAKGRLASILALTASTFNKMAHFDTFTIREIGTESGPTGVGDTGFRKEFRDSLVDKDRAADNHRDSSDQIGHFLTAVEIGFSVTDSERQIARMRRRDAAYEAKHPYKSFLRDVIGGGKVLTNKVALQFDTANRLLQLAMIGHELTPDSSGTLGVRSTAVAPFKASDDDVANFFKGRLDLIKIDDTQRGDSYQDILLTWVGYRFGQNMANNKFSSKEDAARWLEMMLTETDLNAVPTTDPFYSDAQEIKGLLAQVGAIELRNNPNRDK